MNLLTTKDIKVIGLSSIGGALEFFEFTIYALFAHYLSSHFFPNQNAQTALMATFGVYALGYFARPLGGMLFGHIGDKYGRKSAFTLSILLMALATLLIGCLPSYQTIGISSPLILIVLRLVQGVSVGGEIAGATIFTAEHLPVQQRGLGIGIVFMGITLGNTLGGITGYILNFFLGDTLMMAWGWRLPFLIGFILGIFSYLVRKNTLETPVFQEIADQQLLQRLPLVTLMKFNYRPFIIGFCLMAIPSTMISFSLYFPVYLATFLNFKLTDAFLLNIVSFLTLSVLTAFWGGISDYVDRKKLAWIGCCIMAIVGYIAFNFLLKPEVTHIFIFICLLSAAASIINGCYALMIAELFPAAIRYSGMGASYSVGVAIFGGLGPIAFTLMTNFFHAIQAPYYYLLFAILITAISIFFYQPSIEREV